MHNCLPNMKIIHFADDSTMFMHYKKNSDCSSTVNDDLMALESWLSANRLFLNIKKNKYMIINNRDKPSDLNLMIGNSIIDRTEEHMFLALTKIYSYFHKVQLVLRQFLWYSQVQI